MKWHVDSLLIGGEIGIVGACLAEGSLLWLATSVGGDDGSGRQQAPSDPSGGHGGRGEKALYLSKMGAGLIYGGGRQWFEVVCLAGW